jgi:ABC-type branched-subunit amino acid transport system substrate-binding protein
MTTSIVGLRRRSARACGAAVALAGAAVGAVLLAGCTVNGGPVGIDPATSGTVAPALPATPSKVAILVPLSSQGHPGVIARSLKQAAELALLDRDNRGVELTVKDDKGTPEGAKAAAEDALKAGATLILGPLYAKSVGAVAPVARKAGVPVVAFSSDRQVAGNGVYLLSFQPTPEVERIVAFTAKRGKTRFAALIPRDDFGKLVEPVFRDAVTRNGGTVAALETYPATANALLDPLRKISAAIAAAEAQRAPIDALFMPGGQEYLELLARLLPQAKIDTGKVKLIGTGGMDYPNAGRDASLLGAWYPGPDPRGWSEFAQKYAKAYQAAPPRIAGLAHDAMNLVIALAGDASGDGFSAAALTRVGGFSGIDGAYRLLPDGTTDRALAILEVQKFGSTVIEPAPSLGGTPAAAAASGKSFSLLKAFQ